MFLLEVIGLTATKTTGDYLFRRLRLLWDASPRNGASKAAQTFSQLGNWMELEIYGAIPGPSPI